MKKRVVLLLTSLFIWMSSILAQDVPVGVIVAFKKGNSQELNRYLGDQVDLIIQNRTKTANKQITEGAMATFFAKNKVTNFNVNHQGVRDESSFVIGTLVTENGNFRVNCFFKKIQNKYVIHQIRIDKSNE